MRSSAALALLLAARAGAVSPVPAGAAAAAQGAGAPAASGEGLPLTPARLKVVDEMIVQAGLVVGDVESAAAGTGDLPGCPSDFSTERLAADLRAGRLTALGGDLPGGDAKRDWLVYHVCRALAASSPAPCAEADALKASGALNERRDRAERAQGVSAPADYAQQCSLSYYQARAIAAWAGQAPEFMAICRDSAPHLAEFKPGDAPLASVCAAWRAYKGDPGPLEAAINGALVHPLGRAYLDGVVRELVNDPSDCARREFAYERPICEGLADFGRARNGGGSGACRTGLCRALFGGGPAACVPYAVSFVGPACRLVYGPELAAQRRKDFEQASKAIETALQRLDPGGTVDGLKEINSRLDVVYSLRARLDAAVESLAPVTKPRAGSGGARRPRSP